MTLEGSAATQYNGATSDFTVLVRPRRSARHFSGANLPQIIGPIALAAAYFSMPQAMILLQPNSRSFIIVIIVFMIALRVLFVISNALPGFTWWWKIIKTGMKALKVDGIACNVSSLCPFRTWLVSRRDQNHRDRNTHDIETGTELM